MESGSGFRSEIEPNVMRRHYIQQGTSLSIYIDSPEKRELAGELKISYHELGFIRFFNIIINGTYYNSTPDFGV